MVNAAIATFECRTLIAGQPVFSSGVLEDDDRLLCSGSEVQTLQTLSAVVVVVFALAGSSAWRKFASATRKLRAASAVQGGITAL